MKKLGLILLMMMFQANASPFSTVVESLLNERPLEGRSLTRFKANLLEIKFEELDEIPSRIPDEARGKVKSKLYPLLNWDCFMNEELPSEDLGILGLYTRLFSREDPNYAYIYAKSILETKGPSEIAIKWFLEAALHKDNEANDELFSMGLIASLDEGIREDEIGGIEAFREKFMKAYQESKERLEEIRARLDLSSHGEGK